LFMNQIAPVCRAHVSIAHPASVADTIEEFENVDGHLSIVAAIAAREKMKARTRGGVRAFGRLEGGNRQADV
jgi:hypothetical protein